MGNTVVLAIVVGGIIYIGGLVILALILRAIIISAIVRAFHILSHAGSTLNDYQGNDPEYKGMTESQIEAVVKQMQDNEHK